MPGAFKTEDVDLYGEDPTAPMETELEAETKPVEDSKPIPVIETGDMIILRFKPAARKHVFDDGGNFEQAEELIDPAIEEHKTKSGRSLSLDRCLNDFTKTERLDPDNLWKCPRAQLGC